MTAKVSPPGSSESKPTADLDPYDQQLMTAVVDRAEKAAEDFWARLLVRQFSLEPA